MSQFAIKPLADEPQIRSALGDLLIETVASGGSVSFMHPLSPDDADAFWQDSLGAAARGELLGHRPRQLGLGRHLFGVAELVHLRRAVEEVPQQR